jgi:flagellar biosynthesis/type III secretory pathway chaperone
MNELVDKLIDLLQEEEALFHTLATILEKEKLALLSSDVAMLSEITKKKENEVFKFRLLEEKRETTVNLIAKRLGLNANAVSLPMIADKMSSAYSKILMNLSKNLEQFLQSVKTMNQNNKKLVEHSLGLVKDSLSLLDNLLSSSPVYHQNGRFNQSNMQTGRLICNTI